MAHYVRKLTEREDNPLVLADFIQRILQSHTLPTLPEKIDNLVLWMGKRSPISGEQHMIAPHSHCAVVGTDPDGLKQVLQEAVDLGYIKVATARDLFVVKIAGWNRYTELSRGAAVTRSAFMAMKYGDDLLDRVVAEWFIDAVRKTGFELRRLDDDPRAGLIDDRLRVEIRTARFLIADLTHGNQGAYWEAGYAEGLGKPVIYTCQQSVFDDPNQKPHFDTNHHLTVRWNENNLAAAAEELKNTIRATLPGEARLIDD